MGDLPIKKSRRREGYSACCVSKSNLLLVLKDIKNLFIYLFLGKQCRQYCPCQYFLHKRYP